jgi:hypothetical protein
MHSALFLETGVTESDWRQGIPGSWINPRAWFFTHVFHARCWTPATQLRPPIDVVDTGHRRRAADFLQRLLTVAWCFRWSGVPADFLHRRGRGAIVSSYRREYGRGGQLEPEITARWLRPSAMRVMQGGVGLTPRAHEAATRKRQRGHGWGESDWCEGPAWQRQISTRLREGFVSWAGQAWFGPGVCVIFSFYIFCFPFFSFQILNLNSNFVVKFILILNAQIQMPV